MYSVCTACPVASSAGTACSVLLPAPFRRVPLLGTRIVAFIPGPIPGQARVDQCRSVKDTLYV
jgi:hypothetical protein